MSTIAEPRERQFTLNGMTLAAQEWGQSGALPILALHGWLDNCASFHLLAPQLERVHLVALDMAGHGRSDHRPGCGAYSLWDDIQDVFAVADALGWQKFVLLGHSRGAIVSALIAASFPERIQALALIEGLMPEPVRAEDAPLQLANSLKGLSAQLNKSPTIYPNLELVIKARERGMFPLSHRAADLLTRRGIRSVAGGYSWASDPRLLAPSPVRLTREQVEVFIAAIKVPNCLVLAREGLPKLYSGYLQELKKYPQIRYRIFEGAHHLHLEEQAPAVADYFNEFFSSIAASIDLCP